MPLMDERAMIATSCGFSVAASAANAGPVELRAAQLRGRSAPYNAPGLPARK